MPVPRAGAAPNTSGGSTGDAQTVGAITARDANHSPIRAAGGGRPRRAAPCATASSTAGASPRSPSRSIRIGPGWQTRSAAGDLPGGGDRGELLGVADDVERRDEAVGDLRGDHDVDVLAAEDDRCRGAVVGGQLDAHVGDTFSAQADDGGG